MSNDNATPPNGAAENPEAIDWRSATVRRGGVRLRTDKGEALFPDALHIIIDVQLDGAVPDGGAAFALKLAPHVFVWMSDSRTLHLVGETWDSFAGTDCEAILTDGMLKIHARDGSGAEVAYTELEPGMAYPAKVDGLIGAMIMIIDLERGLPEIPDMRALEVVPPGEDNPDDTGARQQP